MTSTFEWNLWEGKITDKFVILSAKKHYYDGLNEICLRICIKDGLWTISKKKDGVVYFQKKGHCNTSGTNPEIEFEGATVCRCTAHNLSFVLGNRESEEIAPAIGIGSQIRLERAGEVIPKCGEVYYTEDVQPLEYPSVCPVCHSATYVDGVDLCCSNADCPGVLKKQLETFSSKSCFNLKGFGEQTISTIVDCGIIKNFPDVFDIWQHKEQLLNVDGFGVKSFDSICMQLKTAARQICQMLLPVFLSKESA